SVCLILGAGNVASIPPLDVVNKLFNEGQVALLKMNPVNEYLGEIFEEIFAEFIEAGYVRFVYGGVEVGAYLTSHDDVDTIHVTGSANTYNTIRYGTGAEGERNRSLDTPINDKPISAELGGVSPTIVVPGEWSRADLRFQADNVVTSKMNNAGFNCIATQILVLPESWELKEAFLDEIRNVFRDLEDRDAYYPGVADRCEAVMSGSGVVETFGSDAGRLLVTGLDATDIDDAAFITEYFAPALSVVTLPSQDVTSYVAAATVFANETLAGTLGASIIVHPKTEKAYPAAIDNMVESLRYGGIGVNTWSASVYLSARCVWGAYPGHSPSDIGSGVGVVHNALMFSSAQKSVARAPFAPSHRTLGKGEFHIAPKPVFFLSNRQSHTTSRYLVDFTLSGKTTDLLKVVGSAIRG
ncbi:MAG: aldehyde dehydrogenase family protein, partial [Acidimicrobiia bacterium]